MTITSTSTTIATAIGPPRSWMSMVTPSLWPGAATTAQGAFIDSSMTRRRFARLGDDRLDGQDQTFLADNLYHPAPLDRGARRGARRPLFTKDVDRAGRLEVALDFSDRARRQESACASTEPEGQRRPAPHLQGGPQDDERKEQAPCDHREGDIRRHADRRQPWSRRRVESGCAQHETDGTAHGQEAVARNRMLEDEQHHAQADQQQARDVERKTSETDEREDDRESPCKACDVVRVIDLEQQAVEAEREQDERDV